MLRKIKIVLSLLVFISAAVHAQQYSGKLKIEKLVDTSQNSIGQKIVYPQFKDPKVTMCKITFPPGENTGWHKHLIPVFSYVLQGTLTVEIEGKGTVEYKEGSSFVESYDTYHRGINKGNTDVVLFVVYLGGDGQRLAIKKQ
ncbi:cupin domain-containing protein [Chitinophaga sancti]|uniref:Cupin domain-containing protein n=1 Tax=Chitinophaga sancti TaxID=1004 RepID=A0A1K1MWC9_9BACT|nr:cupin domain-containing protein [Chitinophaga sancti]WQD63037.1 cupin domain-containing protein [Chitinophaga sancti]WQG91338.1 cupin domain-containing protein [Chitinophaga sancti]SFW27309.1 Cupin domain-containing protein [Chitinophaga sancti]